MSQKMLLFLCLLYFFIVQTVQQEPGNISALITCYDWGGTPFTNNFRCPGSQSCCGDISECTLNQFCVRADEIIRPTCMSVDYEGCSPLCHYSNTLTTQKLPRVQQCADGTFCCENQPDCCQQGTGVALDKHGSIISSSSSRTTALLRSLSSSLLSTTTTTQSSSISTRTTSTSSSTSISSSATIAALALPTASTSPTPQPKPSSNKAAIIAGAVSGSIGGLGLLVLVAWLLLRKTGPLATSYPSNQQKEVLPQPSFYPQQQYGSYGPRYVSEAPVEIPGEGIYDRLVELPGGLSKKPTVHEM